MPTASRGGWRPARHRAATPRTSSAGTPRAAGPPDRPLGPQAAATVAVMRPASVRRLAAYVRRHAGHGGPGTRGASDRGGMTTNRNAVDDATARAQPAGQASARWIGVP